MGRSSIFLLLILSFVVQIKSQEDGNTPRYSPEELLSKIFNFNATSTPRRNKYSSINYWTTIGPPTNDHKLYPPFTFVEQPNTVPPGTNSPIKFGDHFGPQRDYSKPNQPFVFEDQAKTAPSGPNTQFKFENDQKINTGDYANYLQQTNNLHYANNVQGITFQDDNKIDDSKSREKKRKKRRRKPKNQNGVNPGYPQGYPSQYPNISHGYPDPYPGNVVHEYPPQVPNLPQHPGNVVHEYPPQVPNLPQNPGYPGNPQGYPGYGPGYPQGVPGRPGQYPHQYPGGPAGQFYRPTRRRPKQSFASEALTAVTEALTSIALYDDYQCVPRLLCEAAGGGALGSSSVLQNIAGLQPLLTLLAAYNGISSSPLFIFGRAVFLGMTSKGNLGTCRYAYPQCPNDPEQLVHYLNNHNGGFFRFFNAPQANNPQGEQNVEQFYNQLSQNYGFNHPSPNQLTNQQNYGIYQPNVPNQQNNVNYQPNIPNQQNYGLYQPYSPPQFNNPNQANPQGHLGYPYGNGPQNYGLQNYGPTYPYQNNQGYYKNIGKEQKENEIEKRILNKPGDYVSDDDSSDNIDNPKWLFPESSEENSSYNNYRGGRDLKFPDEVADQHSNFATFPYKNRRGKGFSFPNYQNNNKYVNYNKEPVITATPSYIRSNNNYGVYQNKYNTESTTQKALYQNSNSHVKYNNDYNKNNYDNQNKFNQNDNDEGLQTVYVIRGNGDPNHPEIVKLKPGEKLL